jgi:hypothetical protein
MPSTNLNFIVVEPHCQHIPSFRDRPLELTEPMRIYEAHAFVELRSMLATNCKFDNSLFFARQSTQASDIQGRKKANELRQ